METEPERESVSEGVAAILVAFPIVAGAAVFVLFESGVVHRLGLYLMGAGVIVGVALLLSRTRS